MLCFHFNSFPKWSLLWKGPWLIRLISFTREQVKAFCFNKRSLNYYIGAVYCVNGLSNAKGWAVSDTFYVAIQIFLDLPLSRVFGHLLQWTVAATDFAREKYDNALLCACAVYFSPLTLWWSVRPCRSPFVPMHGQPRGPGVSMSVSMRDVNQWINFSSFPLWVDCSELVVYTAYWKMGTEDRMIQEGVYTIYICFLSSNSFSLSFTPAS